MSEQQLVDANELCKLCKESGSQCIKEACEVTYLTTIEARPVVRGKWVSPTKICGYIVPLPHCSNCNEHQNDETNFCPSCGADMREVTANDY